MAKAMSRLHALVANDPEHPAVLEFIGKLSSLLESHEEYRDHPKTDAAVLTCVYAYVAELEKRLLSGL